jgi:hypothetical protein
MKAKEIKKRNQIRYNLHREIRKEGYKLITRKRTIYIFFQNLDFTKNVIRLRDEFGYSIQTELEQPAKHNE